MRIRPDDPDLSQFDESARQLGDVDLADRLTRLLTSLEQGSVIIFNGGWGVGKTTFIRRWLSQLAQKQIPSVYLDAFAVDYLESPFLAVAGAISEAVERAHKKGDPKYKRFLGAAAKVGRSLVAPAAKIGVRVATMGALDLGDFKDLEKTADVVSDALSDYSEANIKNLIDQHDARQTEVTALRESLAELPDLLTLTNGDSKLPLIVVIDELDRCRPDFALGLIEVLKHFFRAQRTHFVLVANRRQIENSIHHRYGEAVNAIEYLRKFYDFQVDYEIDYSEKHSSKVLSYIYRLHTSLMPNVQDGRYIRDYIADMARAHKLSLRDVENIYTNLALAYAVIDNRYRPAVLVAVLALLKVIAPDSYAKAKTGELTFEELDREAFSGRNWGEFNIDRLRAVLQYHLDKDINPDDPEWRDYGRSLWQYDIDRLRAIKFIANAIIDRFEPPSEAQGAA